MISLSSKRENFVREIERRKIEYESGESIDIERRFKFGGMRTYVVDNRLIAQIQLQKDSTNAKFETYGRTRARSRCSLYGREKIIWRSIASQSIQNAQCNMCVMHAAGLSQIL